MKKISKTLACIAAIAAAAILPLSSCGDKEKLQKSEATNDMLNAHLQETLATQDSLFVLINEITEGMTQIKEIERIVTTPGTLTSESPSRKEQLKSDMMALQQALQARRERLEELEKQLAESSGQNKTLLTTISNLKAQIAEQQTEITTLNNQLAEAGIKITALGTQVDSLSNVVNEVTESRDLAEQEAEQIANELNTCYYVVGSQSELKKNNIIETGFLRKTKVLPSDFNASYFTKADKRTLTEVPTHAKKAEVMTNQPKDTYSIEDGADGQKVIKIKDPARFWSLSNFLVVKVN
ncbi:MAG: hypothetical protein NC342_05870 [Pseudoflavonifractor sp.]|nr:hypothetical protein [Alloprevotella sp.]MCM1117044.1 hypothetical protein [Pseudoflavonifractor sp.]